MSSTTDELVKSGPFANILNKKKTKLKVNNEATTMDDETSKFNDELYYWKRQLSESLPLLRASQPTFLNLTLKIPLALRIRNYMKKEIRLNHDPIYNYHTTQLKSKNPGAVSGMPLGGIGAGSISRTVEGDFWQMNLHPSAFSDLPVYTNQFSCRVKRQDGFYDDGTYAQVLSTKDPQRDNIPSMLHPWKWGLDKSKVTVRALYPRLWIEYNEPVPGIKLVCRQVSPVIPGDYRNSSLPVGVFHWTIENTGDDDCDFSLMFTFQNGEGSFDRDFKGGYDAEIVTWEGFNDTKTTREIRYEDNEYDSNDSSHNNSDENHMNGNTEENDDQNSEHESESYYPENDDEEEKTQKIIVEELHILQRNYVSMKGVQLNQKYGERPYSKGTFSIMTMENKLIGEKEEGTNQILPAKYSTSAKRRDKFGNAISCFPTFICDHDGNHGDSSFSAGALWNHFESDGKFENDYFGYIPDSESLFYPKSENSYYSLRAALMDTQRKNIAQEREKRRKAMESEDPNDYEQYKEKRNMTMRKKKYGADAGIALSGVDDDNIDDPSILDLKSLKKARFDETVVHQPIERNQKKTFKSRVGDAIGSAVCHEIKDIAPGESRTIVFSLGWDFPFANFGDAMEKSTKKELKKRSKKKSKFLKPIKWGKSLISRNSSPAVESNKKKLKKRRRRKQREKKILQDAKIVNTEEKNNNRSKRLIDEKTKMPRGAVGISLPKRYTRYFGRSGYNAPELCWYALLNYPTWEEKIDEWQKPILDNENIPSFVKSLLFNELYYLTNGGTFWTDSEHGWPLRQSRLRSIQEVMDNSKNNDDIVADLNVIKALMEDNKEADRTCDGEHSSIGQFLILKNREELVYNSYHDHYYSSIALVKLFPMLELSVQRDYFRAYYHDDVKPRLILYTNKKVPKDVRNQMVYDIGTPSGRPFHNPNEYNLIDIKDNVDLGLKLVITTHRDFMKTGAYRFLVDMYPVMNDIMNNIVEHVMNNSCLIVIEPNTQVDRYYSWHRDGINPHLNGLWISALQAYCWILKFLERNDIIEKYNKILTKATIKYFSNLWNEDTTSFNFTSVDRHPNYDCIHADQLSGAWYSTQSYLPHLFPSRHYALCLISILKSNILRFHKGKLGAINGMKPDGIVDRSSDRSSEVSVSTCYSLASTFLQEALRWEKNEFFEISTVLFKASLLLLKSIWKTSWVQNGYWFNTPSSWDEEGRYRSLGDVKGLSIWAFVESKEFVDETIYKSLVERVRQDSFGSLIGFEDEDFGLDDWDEELDDVVKFNNNSDTNNNDDEIHYERSIMLLHSEIDLASEKLREFNTIIKESEKEKEKSHDSSAYLTKKKRRAEERKKEREEIAKFGPNRPYFTSREKRYDLSQEKLDEMMEYQDRAIEYLDYGDVSDDEDEDEIIEKMERRVRRMSFQLNMPETEVSKTDALFPLTMEEDDQLEDDMMDVLEKTAKKLGIEPVGEEKEGDSDDTDTDSDSESDLSTTDSDSSDDSDTDSDSDNDSDEDSDR